VNLGALAVGAALLAVNAFFVAAEFALLAARRSRIEQLAAAGDARAVQALRGIRELSVMLAGAQLGITMASLGLGAVAEPALAHGFELLLEPVAVPAGVRHTIAFTVALTIVVFLHMVVGEMAPKSWAIANPERSALVLARPFRAFALLVRPVIRALNAMANGVVRLCGVEPQDELAQAHRPSELLLLVEESAEQGTLEAEQSTLLARALDLPDLDAQGVMVPRADVVAVPADADVAAIERAARDSGRSRLPVYRGDLDDVVGIVHVKDVLGVPPERRESTTAADLATPAMITPESRPVEDLMLDMRQQRQHVAMVVDEHGSITGLVALEDLLEELIGEFEDESDRRVRSLARQTDGALFVPGVLRPDELEDRMGVALPAGEWETVAGYVIAQLGRLPSVGDAVDADGARLEVATMEGHRVVELRVSTSSQPR
jgi:CBS domain containing-hemolysin-like protein